jgi:predicted RNase H-related nuclease YkuK (DUF458 family)
MESTLKNNFMEKYFKTIEGKYVNIVNHTVEYLNKYPNVEIFVGTDSQTEHGYTMYATTIVYRYGTRGAHYIVFKEQVDREKVEYNRLYNEGVRTIEAANILKNEIPSLNPILEFDYADVNKTISTQLVNAFRGYYEDTRFKSSNPISTRAANNECRKTSNMFKLEEALKQAA